jgi:hypothetical protein
MPVECAELQKENMRSKLKNMMCQHLLFFGLFIFLISTLSFEYKFNSPFCDNTPSQLVFLACLVTSTVALTVIGNRFRDRMDNIDKEKLEIALKPKPLDCKRKKRLTKINNTHDECKIGLFHMTYILAVQIIMTCLTCFRILFKSHSMDESFLQFIDKFLIYGSVICSGFYGFTTFSIMAAVNTFGRFAKNNWGQCG